MQQEGHFRAWGAFLEERNTESMYSYEGSEPLERSMQDLVWSAESW